MKNIFLLFFLFACSSGPVIVNEEQVLRKGEGYTSPNQKVEAEILVQEKPGSRPQSSIIKGVLKVGSIVPKHTHPESDEYLVFLRGAGELTIEDQTYHLKDGDTVFIPKGKTHSYVNRSGKDAVFYQIYTPGGPERKFKQWSKKQR